MDFNKLVDASHEHEVFALRPNSLKTYNEYIGFYSKQLSEINGAPDPFPINENKMRAYIEYSVHVKQNPITFSTVKCYIAAFSWYFRSNNMNDCTKSHDFKQYIKSLKVSMGGSCPPNRKEPILPIHLTKYALSLKDTNNDIIKMTIFSLMFYGFLRVSVVKI